ncbi:MAG: hypothetical protein OXG72_12600 [Acidobacteria bacterium]|nr:hypothetical protein [Acidobacteriota bacterium]
MRKPGTVAASGQRPAARTQHAVLHLRPRSRHIASAVIEGPFDEGGEALETAARLRRTAAAGDQVEVLTGAGAWLGSDPEGRAGRAEELARRLLRRIRGFPKDFDARAATARRPPGTLFALACMEAPRAARRLAEALDGAVRHSARPMPALVGQILLGVPHEAAVLLHAIRWPSRWFPSRGGRYASRPADAPTACAVLAARLRRGRWPGPGTALSHRIREEP